MRAVELSHTSSRAGESFLHHLRVGRREAVNTGNARPDVQLRPKARAVEPLVASDLALRLQEREVRLEIQRAVVVDVTYSGGNEVGKGSNSSHGLSDIPGDAVGINE